MIAHQFPNGLTAVCVPRPDLETVNLSLWLRHGSMHDRAGQRGISHLAEHLFFARDVSWQGETINPLFWVEGEGGIVDAATFRDATRYQIRMHKHNWQTYLQLLFHLHLEAELTEERVDAERQILDNEIREYMDYPDAWAPVLADRALFGADAAVASFIGGSVTDLPNIGCQDVLDHWHSITADRVFVFVMGPVEPDEVFALVEEYARSMPEGVSADEEIPVTMSNGVVQEASEEKDLVTLGVSMQMPSLLEPGYFSGELLMRLLAGASISRLTKALRHQHGLIYDLDIDYDPLRTTGVLNIVTSFAAEKAAQVIDVLFRELEDLVESGFAEEEVAKLRRYKETQQLLSLEQPNLVVKWTGLMMTRGRLMSWQDYADGLRGVTADGVNRLLCEVLREGRIGFGLIGGGPELVERIAENGKRLQKRAAGR